MKLVPYKRADVTAFNPIEAAENDAKANAIIAYAKRVKDWPLLEEAVDKKIEDQAEFIKWWENAVRRPGGKEAQAINAERDELVTCDYAEGKTGIRQEQVSRWRHYLSNEKAYRERLLGAGYRAAALMEPNVRGTQGTGDNEWFTPSEHIERARKVLGGIDLDPASHPLAQERVRAHTFFTNQHGSLEREWHGNVWLNPPYSQPLIEQFIDKLLAELKAFRIAQAILLTHNYTDTAWFHKAAFASALICFTRGRIRFEAPHGELAAPTQGQAFFYFGNNHEAFISHFSDVGFIVGAGDV